MKRILATAAALLAVLIVFQQVNQRDSGKISSAHPPLRDKRVEVMEARQRLAEKGRRLFITRVEEVEGVLFHEMGGPMPVEFVPEPARRYLTTEDLIARNVETRGRPR
jgi:hypothetical protein